MLHHRRSRWVSALVLLALLLASAALPLAAAPAPQNPPTSLQAMFAAAAKEFGVPENLLLAVSYNLSRWEHHGGQPSASAGYGLLHLTQAPRAVEDAKGLGETTAKAGASKAPTLQTLAKAAGLTGMSAATLKADPYQNIRGGAALLAQYARETTGGLPSNLAGWYEAVARYSGSPNAANAHSFAAAVYETLQTGVTHTTTGGETLSIAPTVVQGLPPAKTDDVPTPSTPPECPAGLVCHFIPAAYVINTPGDPTDYGNYDLADREANGLDVRYIVIHNTETSYNEAIDIFLNPLSYVSAHYVIRSSDGDITQMVRSKDVAYQAGNWFINTHSIGIEHEGVAIEGATWYTEAMYRASARLVRYLADKYNIPLDRAHIIGHDDVPGISATSQRNMHWDPGPFWDWAHYMELLGAPLVRVPELRDRNLVMINPAFNTNRPAVRGCDPEPCRPTVRQPSNFVYLYQSPSFDAPFIVDPAKPNVDGDLAENWGDKASTGQMFWRVEQRGDWSAIFFGGQTAWFYNPRNAPTAGGVGGMAVTPKAGKTSIPVYGTGYPDPSSFPAGIPVRARNPLQYTIPAGQAYVAMDLVGGDFYYAPTYTFNPADHLVVKGPEKFYQIFFNHRFAFVKADDVDVVYVR